MHTLHDTCIFWKFLTFSLSIYKYLHIRIYSNLHKHLFTFSAYTLHTLCIAFEPITREIEYTGDTLKNRFFNIQIFEYTWVWLFKVRLSILWETLKCAIYYTNKNQLYNLQNNTWFVSDKGRPTTISKCLGVLRTLCCLRLRSL